MSTSLAARLLVVVLAHFLDGHESRCVLLDLVDSPIAATKYSRP
jgi:hypothetical protein